MGWSRVHIYTFLIVHVPFYASAHLEMAAPAPKGPCRYFGTREGCRNNNCKFSHDLRPKFGTRTPFQFRQNASSSSTAARRFQSGRNTPKNVCDFYWNTGQCKRGFDCTFKHQKNINSRTNTAGEEEDNEDAANEALDFFTMDNLTHMAGVGLHRTQEGTPEQAHNSIKQYLEGGSLNNPSEMSNLVSILASINRRNHSWVRVIPPFMLDGF